MASLSTGIAAIVICATGFIPLLPYCDLHLWPPAAVSHAPAKALCLSLFKTLTYNELSLLSGFSLLGHSGVMIQVGVTKGREGSAGVAAQSYGSTD